jgi:Protein of unknown function (DUF1214)
VGIAVAPGERARWPAGRGMQRTARSFRVGAILVVVPLVLVGCTSGPPKTARNETSAPRPGQSSSLATATPGSAATLIQPPGPVSAHPALLDEARAATTELAGDRSYEIRFPAGDLPPHGSDGFWSVTLYNAAGFFVANPINRYSVGNETPGLVQGADGSLTIVVSASRPSAPGVNWLPAPAGTFSLAVRVYDPAQQVLDGSWTPPAVQAIG